MRKICCFVLASLLFMGGALAQMDISGMTIDELNELKDLIEERIDELINAEPQAYYESGTYRIGLDMPEGVYLLKEDGIALFPSVLVSVDEESTIGPGYPMAYELVLSNAVIRFDSGSYVTLTAVTAYPFDQAPEVTLDENGAASEGGYWVGEQIPAGYYRIVPQGRTVPASYSLYDDILGTNAQLLEFEVIDSVTELVLEEGQYISLSGCSIEWLS